MKQKNQQTKPHSSILRRVFGELKMTWPRVIILAIIMGFWTALMALLVPDGNSFHDIVATPEWWVLPAIIVIINCKTPLDAALKTFVFFLISQPLAYLFQVPFNSIGWRLFGYYPYWFGITLLTFPAAFITWFIKKDKWYSGLILSIITAYLAIYGIIYVYLCIETPPNHLISAIYCFAMVPLLVFSILKDKTPRLIAALITIIAICIYIPLTLTEPFEVYDNTFYEGITFEGEPFISFWAGNGAGNVEIIKNDESYTFKIAGEKGKEYSFSISDDENEYNYRYYYNDEQKTVIVEPKE